MTKLFGKRTGIIAEIFFVTIIFLIACWVRLSFLPAKYFSIDEAFQLTVAGQKNWHDALSVIAGLGPFQPNLLDYALDFFLHQWTGDLIFFRLLRVLYGTVACVVLYAVLKNRQGRAVAIGSAVLLAFSTFHTEASLTIRSYALVTLFSVTSIIVILNVNKNVLWNLAYVINMFLFQLLYSYAFIFVLAHAAVLIFCGGASLKKIALILSPILLGGLTWYQLTGPGLMTMHESATLTNHDWLILLRDNMLTTFHEQRAVLAIPLCLFMIGIRHRFKIDGSKNTTNWLLLSIFIFLIAGVLASLKLLQFIVHPRYFIAALPIIILYVANGIDAIACALAAAWESEKPWLKDLIFFGLVAGMAGLSWHISQKTFRPQAKAQQQLVQSTAILAQQIKPNDMVIFANPNLGATYLHYFDPEAFARLSPPRLKFGFAFFKFEPGFTSVKTGNLIFSLCPEAPEFSNVDATSGFLKKPGRLWLIYYPLNYFYQAWPFKEALGIDQNKTELAGPGLYRYDR